MIVEVSAFREALKKVGVAVVKRATLPIMSSVLIETKGVGMTIKSTNLESGVIATLPCKSDADFSARVPFEVLSQFMSEGNGQVSFDFGKGLEVSRPTIGKLSIGVVGGKEFPPLPAYKPEVVWNKLDAKEVSRLFGIVAFGCAADESRPVLTAVCCRDGEIASADGLRLYNAKSEKFTFGLGKGRGDNGTTYPINKLIPKATVLKFIQLFKNTEEVEVAWGDNLVFFRTLNCTLVSQLVQGTYPKYEQLIPISFSGKAAFSVPLMVQRLNMMKAVKDGSNTVRMIFTQEDRMDVCYLQSNQSGDLDTPEFDMTMPCKIETEGRIAIQHNFLLDAIKSFSICSVELPNPSSPMKITGDIEGLTVVVMPMFVQW